MGLQIIKKNGLFNKWWWENWKPILKKSKKPHSSKQIHSKCTNVLNKKQNCDCTTRKCLKNIFIILG